MKATRRSRATEPMTAPSASVTATGCGTRALTAHRSASGVSAWTVGQAQAFASERASSMTASAVSTRDRSTSWMKEAT